MGFFTASTWAGNAKAPTLPRCGACGLARQCHSPRMAVSGRGKRPILFVAEAPGEEEDRQGTQLIGQSGQCLRGILRELRVDLDDCWKTNAVICRPPKNQMLPVYMESCRPNLLKTVADLKPRVVVVLGETALESLIGPEWPDSIDGIGRWAGWHIPSARYGAWVCPTYHPSYLVRMNEDVTLRMIVKGHIEQALGLERRPLAATPLANYRKRVEVITSPAMGRKRMRGLVAAKGDLAFDYETTGLKPERAEQQIFSCAFCLNGEDTFATRVDADSLRVLSKVLRNPLTRKRAANLKFEERWTRAKLGHGVANWEWDTMLAAHWADNRADICGLKFQAYVQFGIPDYASSIKPYLESARGGRHGANGLNRIHEAPLEDLLMYNGLDALFEYHLADRQKALLGH